MSAQGDQFGNIWALSFARYKESTGRDLTKLSVAPELHSLHSYEDLEKTIEQSYGNFKGFRDKHKTFHGCLKRAMMPVQLFGALTQSALSLTPFAPASVVFGAAMYLVDAANGVSHAYDAIEKLFDSIGQSNRRFKEYAKDQIEDSLREIMVKLMCQMLEIFATAEMWIRKRVKLYIRSLFMGEVDSIKALLDKLDGLVKEEAGLVMAIISRKTGQIQKTGEFVSSVVEQNEKSLANIGTTTARLETKLDSSANESKESANRQIIEKNLRSESFDKILDLYEEMKQSRVDESGLWILKEIRYKDWVSGTSPLLCVYGIPGSGKSYLSTRIIDDLWARYPQASQLRKVESVAFYYLKEEDTRSLRKIDDLIRTLAFQIAKNDEVFRSQTLKFFNSSNSARHSNALWTKLFVEYFSSKTNENAAFIVIDGLDEALPEERKRLFKMLGDMQDRKADQSPSRLHFLLLGQTSLLTDINEHEQLRMSMDFLELSSSRNCDDIERYVNREIPSLRFLRSLRRKFPDAYSDWRHYISEELIECSGGVFLWVKLVLQELKTARYESDVTSTLQNTPRDMDKAYLKVFNKVTEGNVFREDLKVLLEWVCCAYSPQSLGNLQYILMDKHDGEWRDSLEFDLRISAASFLVLVRGDEKTTDDLQREALAQQKTRDSIDHDSDFDESETPFDLEDTFNSDSASTYVYFMHANIRDFLMKHREDKTFEFSVDKNLANANIALTCLQFMTESADDIESEKSEVVTYAAEFSLLHLYNATDPTQVSQRTRSEILRLLCSVFSNHEIVGRWLSRYPDIHLLLMDCTSKLEHFESIQLWCQDEKALADLDASDREWILSARESPAAFFKPLATSLAIKTFHKYHTEVQDEGEDLDKCIDFLNAYVNMAEPAKEDEDFTNLASKYGDIAEISLPVLTPQRVHKIVEYFALEQSSTWHYNLALAFYRYEYFEECMAEVYKVLEKEPDHYLALFMIGSCHRECGNEHRAIAIMEKSLELKLNPITDISYRPRTEESLKDHMIFLKTIADLKCQLKDFQASVECFKEAYELGPDDLDCVDSILNVMARGHLHDQYLSFVERLDQSSFRNTANSQMTELLFQYTHHYQFLGISACVMSRDEFATSILEKAVAAAQELSNEKITRNQRIVFAEFLSRHEPSRISQAINIWMEAYYQYGDDIVIAADQDEAEAKSKTIFHLSEKLHLCALGLTLNGDLFGAKEMITVLWDIATVENSSPLAENEEDADDGWQVTSNYASMMLGLWYDDLGRKDNARQCFAPRILKCIDILEDDDPDNDLDGYLGLAQTLLLAADFENAEAAFATWALPLHRLKKVEKLKRRKAQLPEDQELVQTNPEIQETEKLFQDIRIGNEPLSKFSEVSKSRSPKREASRRRKWTREIDESIGITGTSFDYECDGLCFRRPEDWKTLSVCMGCLETLFCDECLALLREGKLPFKKCDPKHCFIQIFPVKHSPSQRADVKKDGVTYPRPEWLEELKKQWSHLPKTLSSTNKPDIPSPTEVSRLEVYRKKPLSSREDSPTQSQDHPAHQEKFLSEPSTFPPPTPKAGSPPLGDHSLPLENASRQPESFGQPPDPT